LLVVFTQTPVTVEAIGLESVVEVEDKLMATYLLRFAGVMGVVEESVVEAVLVLDCKRTWGPGLSMMCLERASYSLLFTSPGMTDMYKALSSTGLPVSAKALATADKMVSGLKSTHRLAAT
jgi:hypothetical protein